MSKSWIYLRLFGLRLAPQAGVTQRYGLNSPLEVGINAPLNRPLRTRVFSAIEFSDTTGLKRAAAPVAATAKPCE
jgi:hypothetical protein